MLIHSKELLMGSGGRKKEAPYIAFIEKTNGKNIGFSGDGITWSKSALPLSYVSCGVYAKDKYIVFDGNGNLAYSSDCVNWTAKAIGISVLSVVYGNDIFVAVCGDRASASSTAAYSYDGINWTTTSLKSSQFWIDLAFGDGKFVATAGEEFVIFGAPSKTNVAAYSYDGINWTTTTMPSSSVWNKVSYGNGVFLAGTSGFTLLGTAYSYDGIKWNGGSLSSVGSTALMRSFAKDRFFASGSSSGNNPMVYSEDAIHWTSLGSPFVWHDITYWKNNFFCVGGGVVYKSEDLSNWSSASTGINTQYATGVFIV